MAGSAGSVINYYAVLGVSRSASAEEIRAAFLKLALKWHPDKLGNKEAATARFQHIQQAYKVLSDPTRRSLYDVGLYDPTMDKEEEEPKPKSLLNADALGQMLATMDMEGEAPKKKGSSSSSSSSPPVVRIDVTFTTGGKSSTSTAVVELTGGLRTNGRTRTPRRRVPAPSPILKATGLKFP